MKLCLIWPGFLKFRDYITGTNYNYPNDIVSKYYTFKSKSSDANPAIGIALPLIAALTPNIFSEIQIINGETEEIPFDVKFDLVGISMMTAQANEGYRIAKEFKKRGIYTVLGGIHPTLIPDEALMYADTVIIGEAEKTWPVFIEHFTKGKPCRVYQQTEPVDIELSPLPRYDLLPLDFNNSINYIQTSRGCPHGCEYCSVSQAYGHQYRFKSLNKIINEIDFVCTQNQSKRILFSDDNMFVHRARAKELIKYISNLNIRWITQSDIAIAHDDELLNLISRSGCEYLFIGLESVTEVGIACLSSWKHNYFHSYIDSIKKIQSFGISVCGAFIVGMDDHDESVFDKLLVFCNESGVRKINLSILTPFPGTPLRQKLLKEDRILDSPWSNYDFFGVNYLPLKIRSQVLQNKVLETIKLFSDKY